LKTDNLRKKATTTVKKKAPKSIKKNAAPGDLQRLVKELELHKIELELQNEELRKQALDLAAASKRHADLYDFAPTGYVTTNEDGIIKNANLTAATTLGVERKSLLGNPMHKFIEKSSQDQFYLLRKKLFLLPNAGGDSPRDLPVELKMVRSDGLVFDADMFSSIVHGANGKRELMISFSDITARKRREHELLSAQRHLEATLKAIPDLMFEVNLEGRIYNYRAYHQDLLAAPPEVFLGKKFADILPAAAAEVCANALTEASEKGWSAGGVYALPLPPGESWFELSVAAMETAGDVAGRFVLLARDITERKQIEEKALQLAQAVEQSPSSVMICDLDGNMQYVNATFARITGYTREELIGKNPRILQSGKTRKATYVALWEQLLKGGDWRGILYNKRKDGSEYIESATIAPIRNATGKITHYLGVKQDVTDTIAAQNEIFRLCNYDPLTGLPNRRLLNERCSYALSVAQRSNESVAVMFIDLDHFKDINDTLGHKIGDLFLVEIAKRLSAMLREEDTVSRFGGDEFILVFPGTGAKGAATIATKLLTEISRPCHIEEHEVIGTPSIGIAIYPNDADNLEDLLKKADTAMYRVKKDSRNSFRFFTTEMQANSERNLGLLTALRHALDRDELQLHYQPQIRINDGRLFGAEALLRWQHPDLGAISPAEFIPLAEDSGQIIAIGEWVMRTAVEQAKAWIDKGLPPMVIAVNVSAVQFHQHGFVDLLSDILEIAQLPPQYIELELTEAVAMSDPDTVRVVLDQLNERGIHIAIDDFGTGYSSLSYLMRFKVSRLKIDQSFVREIAGGLDGQAIVAMIITLAGSLGIRTIAEGVETVEQLEFLRDNGCDEVQGYYFSKPLPVAQFEEFVRQQKQQS
jgi:diguanylate cyclase (GGDEF)-like protein/PAS domain S-box-containing protein